MRLIPQYCYCIFFLFFVCSASVARTEGRIPSNTRLIVQFNPKTDAQEFVQSWNNRKVARNHQTALQYQRVLSARLNIHQLSYATGKMALTELIQQLRFQKEVHHVQLDRTVEFRTLPNDPWIGRQWPVDKIELDRVWDLNTGGTTAQGDTIVIAILDQGFDVDHEDLFQNIWTNRAEIPFDGIDNDQNGFIDDERGWNYVADGPDFTPNAHGSSVAGIIGARGNNAIGVAGINWQVKLMLFQISEVSHIISAYEYVVQQRKLYNETNGREGAYVVATNASFGADDVFCSQEPLWGAMYDELGAAGILTGAGASNRGSNIDQVGDIPATCASAYLINVLNTNEADQKEPNSSYSTTYIDMGAPGENAYTTKPFDRYGLFGDNSAAAPHITGAIGLMYALACPDLIDASKRQPGQTALFIKDLLLQGVDLIPGLDQYTLSGGRLNVWKAAQLLLASCEQEKEAELAWDRVYPNPAEESVSLEFTLSADQNFQISIFNPTGQLLWSKINSSNPVHTHQREIVNIASWPKGIYFVQIISGDDRVETVFIKQ